MNEKIYYQRLLNNLNDISNNLSNSIQNIESSISKIKRAINVDDNYYKKRDLENVLNDLHIQYKNIQNVYIPEVKRKIMEVE